MGKYYVTAPIEEVEAAARAMGVSTADVNFRSLADTPNGYAGSFKPDTIVRGRTQPQPPTPSDSTHAAEMERIATAMTPAVEPPFDARTATNAEVADWMRSHGIAVPASLTHAAIADPDSRQTR